MPFAVESLKLHRARFDCGSHRAGPEIEGWPANLTPLNPSPRAPAFVRELSEVSDFGGRFC